MDAKLWWKQQEDQWKNDPEYLLEKLKIRIMEDFLEVMERKNVSRSELAKRLGCSNAYVTKLLQGTQNMTLQKLVEIAVALDTGLEVLFLPKLNTQGFTQSTVNVESALFQEIATPLGQYDYALAA